MDILKRVEELQDLFDEDEVTTADNINRPEPKQSVKEIELFNEFNTRNPKAGGGRINFENGTKPEKIKNPNPIEARKVNLAKGAEKRKFIKDELIKKIDSFEKTKLFPKEKYKFNLDSLRSEFKADESTINKVIEELPKKYKNKSLKTKRGQSSKTSLTLTEKQFFADNYQKRTISQMATDLTGKPYENKLTRAKNQQLYRYYLGLKKEDALEKILKGARPKGSVKFDEKSAERYRKPQQELMNLDPKVYKDLTPSQLDNALKKAIRFSGEAAKGTVVGAIDRNAIPKSLLPSFEHFQGITPGTITQDPDALRKVGITTENFNFKVLGAKAKNNIYKKIKNELRTARESIKLNDKKTAKKSIETVNEIYDAVAKNLGTIDRSVLPKYSLSKNTIKETNIKPIKLGKQQNKIEDAIEQYVRFVAGGPKKDVKKIKQPNLKKAVELVKKQDDKALKELIKSRTPDIRQGEFFSNPFFSPGVFGQALKAFPTPAGAAVANLGFGVDPTSAIDRASIAAEAAFAPQLVKQSAKFGPVAQRFFNLGLSPALAARVARVASPLGIASLIAEATIAGAKNSMREANRIDSIKDPNLQSLEFENLIRNIKGFAEGGLSGGDKSGPPPESGPTPHGLQGILNRVKRT